MRQHLFSSTLLAVTFFAFLAVDVHPLPLRGVVLETAQLNIPKTQRDINDVANYGANLVRFPIYFSTPCDLNCWVYFADQAYETASNRGMVMVLDFHHPSEVPGSTITDVDQFVAKWEAFARHFGSRANRPTRILYELCNEPNDRVDWPAVALRAARKIREYDPRSVIVYSPKGNTTGPSTSPSFKPLPSIPDQIINFHAWDFRFQSSELAVASAYRYVGSAGSQSAVNTTLDQLRARLDRVEGFSRRHGIRVYIGEVGIHHSHRDAARFLRDFTDEVDKRGFYGLTLHAFRESPVWDYEADPDTLRVLRRWLG